MNTAMSPAALHRFTASADSTSTSRLQWKDAVTFPYAYDQKDRELNPKSYDSRLKIAFVCVSVEGEVHDIISSLCTFTSCCDRFSNKWGSEVIWLLWEVMWHQIAFAYCEGSSVQEASLQNKGKYPFWQSQI